MITLAIPDMTCGHCKASVEKAIASVAPGARVAVDLAARTATVEGPAEAEGVLKAVEEAGFAPRLA